MSLSDGRARDHSSDGDGSFAGKSTTLVSILMQAKAEGNLLNTSLMRSIALSACIRTFTSLTRLARQSNHQGQDCSP